MGWPMIERIIENLSRLNYSGRVSWFLTNEPLLDARMPEIVQRTRRACPRAFLSLVTNGDLLTSDLYAELKQAGLDALGVTAYDEHTLSRMAAISPDRGLRIINMCNSAGLQLENRAGNIKVNQHYFTRDKVRFSTRSCTRPFTTMAISAQGHVVLCCADLYADVVMGNVTCDSLEDIWNSSGFAHYRQTLVTAGRDSLHLCRECSHDGSSSRITYPLQGQLERSLRQALVPLQTLVRDRRASLRAAVTEHEHVAQ
jgi:radical SAM protein with 4Fe4S-binding SPASM domain